MCSSSTHRGFTPPASERGSGIFKSLCISSNRDAYIAQWLVLKNNLTSQGLPVDLFDASSHGQEEYDEI